MTNLSYSTGRVSRRIIRRDNDSIKKVKRSGKQKGEDWQMSGVKRNKEESDGKKK